MRGSRGVEWDPAQDVRNYHNMAQARRIPNILCRRTDAATPAAGIPSVRRTCVLGMGMPRRACVNRRWPSASGDARLIEQSYSWKLCTIACEDLCTSAQTFFSNMDIKDLTALLFFLQMTFLTGQSYGPVGDRRQEYGFISPVTYRAKASFNNAPPPEHASRGHHRQRHVKLSIQPVKVYRKQPRPQYRTPDPPPPQHRPPAPPAPPPQQHQPRPPVTYQTYDRRALDTYVPTPGMYKFWAAFLVGLGIGVCFGFN